MTETPGERPDQGRLGERYLPAGTGTEMESHRLEQVPRGGDAGRRRTRELGGSHPCFLRELAEQGPVPLDLVVEVVSESAANPAARLQPGPQARTECLLSTHAPSAAAAYSLMPVRAIPCTKFFCSRMNTRSVGRMARMVIADWFP